MHNVFASIALALAAQRIRSMSLVIAGRSDYQAGIKPQRKLAGILPNGRFEVFDASGHFMYVDEAQRFADVVINFLAD